MPSAADLQLAQEVRELILEVQVARDDARTLGPAFHSWFSRAEARVTVLGPRAETYARRLKDVQDSNAYATRLATSSRNAMAGRISAMVVYQWMVDAAAGVLESLASDLEKGLLTDIEDRVASGIYGDVLDEAQTLLNASHLGCAAILTRVGLENGLKRRARREAMPDVDKAKTSVVNDWLQKAGVYHKQTHDSVESWLAPGNAFAHDLPEKDKYTHRDLARTLKDVRGFLGSILT